MVQKLLANGDDGLSIIIVLNSWVKEIDLVASSLSASADKKGAPGLGLFSAFLDAPSSGGGKGAGDGEENDDANNEDAKKDQRQPGDDMIGPGDIRLVQDMFAIGAAFLDICRHDRLTSMG